MREILFRGKRLDDGEWAEGGIYHNSEDEIVFIIKDTGLGYHEFIEVIPGTIGQFTGLYDKNDKKIFEGDIVIHCNENPHGDIEKGQVYWDEDFCGWRRTSNGAFNHGIIDTYRIAPNCVYEVIGNIHDNPELLKGEAE